MNAEPLSDAQILEIAFKYDKDGGNGSAFTLAWLGDQIPSLLATITADRARISTLQALVLESERTVAARDARIAELEGGLKGLEAILRDRDESELWEGK